jgi:hypothetical protein
MQQGKQMNMNALVPQARTILPPAMEHRWGNRVDVDLPVRVEIGGKLVAIGSMRNASISGALIAARANLPPLTTLTVTIHTSVGNRAYYLELPASVVRREPDAIAIEWRDMACQGLVDLLHALRTDAQLFARDIAFG